MRRRLHSKHPIPVEENVLAVSELSLGELTLVWTLGVGSDRSLGRPEEWNGEPSGFDDFAFKFSTWLSGLPGNAERFLEESVTMAQPDSVGNAYTTREGRGQESRDSTAGSDRWKGSELHPTSS